jgi:hypothetical protein
MTPGMMPDAAPDTLDAFESQETQAPNHLASALPDFTLALAYLVAWVAPGRTTPEMLRWLLLTMLLEFIVMHSSAFMSHLVIAGSGRKGVPAVVLLGLFYSIIVGAFSLAFHTAWPLFSFWALMLNRATVLFFRQAPRGDEMRVVGATWSASAMFYVLGCMLTVVAPLPRFGFGPEHVAAMHLNGRGVWELEPWRAMAFGFLYFAAMGAFQLWGIPALNRKAARGWVPTIRPAR